jgi:hypothetical protein
MRQEDGNDRGATLMRTFSAKRFPFDRQRDLTPVLDPTSWGSISPAFPADL